MSKQFTAVIQLTVEVTFVDDGVNDLRDQADDALLDLLQEDNILDRCVHSVTEVPKP